jgi:long-chain acyl-CoA synthetase
MFMHIAAPQSIKTSLLIFVWSLRFQHTQRAPKVNPDMENYPWLQHYPRAVAPTIDPDRYESLVSLFEECFERYHSLPMYENMGKVVSYSDVEKLSSAFAAYLQRHTHLQPGDHIAIQLPNLLQYPIALLGILRAGMVVVNVNPLYTSYEMEQQLRDSKTKAIVLLANFAHKLEKILSKTALQKVIITEIGDMLGKLKGPLVNFSVRHVKRLVPRYNLPQTIAWKQALQVGSRTKFDRVRPRSEQAAFLQYTGGTTGISKGAVLTHRNMVANVEQMVVCMRVKLQEKKEIAITPLPLYHIFALTVNLLAMMRLGAKNVLITNPRDIKGFIKELRKHRFTCISGVNTLFSALLANKAFASLDFSSLKTCLAGGVALQTAVAEQWEATTGAPLVEGYGLTEASPAVTCNMLDGTHRTGTIGIPLPSTVVLGTPGNLLVKGPQVMQTYWQQPEETKQMFLHGWLQTGDVAVMDQDGFIEIIDRKKEMINISGFNVYPNEIENVVSNHPKVLEVGAIGVPDGGGKEEIKLYVVKKDPQLTAEELLAYCKERLTRYKVPKHIVFRDSMPKSNVGKILRRVLKEEAMQKMTN